MDSYTYEALEMQQQTPMQKLAVNAEAGSVGDGATAHRQQ